MLYVMSMLLRTEHDAHYVVGHASGIGMQRCFCPVLCHYRVVGGGGGSACVRGCEGGADSELHP